MEGRQSSVDSVDSMDVDEPTTRQQHPWASPGRTGNIENITEYLIQWLRSNPNTYSNLFVPLLHEIFQTSELQQQRQAWMGIIGQDWIRWVNTYRTIIARFGNISGYWYSDPYQGYIAPEMQDILINMDPQTAFDISQWVTTWISANGVDANLAELHRMQENAANYDEVGSLQRAIAASLNDENVHSDATAPSPAPAPAPVPTVSVSIDDWKAHWRNLAAPLTERITAAMRERNIPEVRRLTTEREPFLTMIAAPQGEEARRYIAQNPPPPSSTPGQTSAAAPPSRSRSRSRSRTRSRRSRSYSRERSRSRPREQESDAEIAARLQAEDDAANTEDCPVCLGEMKLSLGEGYPLECNHRIHIDCLREHLIQQDRQNIPLSCPVCRASIDRRFAREDLGLNIHARQRGTYDVDPGYGEERRVDNDGREYTEDEFFEYYGRRRGQREWEFAGREMANGNRTPPRPAGTGGGRRIKSKRRKSKTRKKSIRRKSKTRKRSLLRKSKNKKEI